jgi:hypothetical protein
VKIFIARLKLNNYLSTIAAISDGKYWYDYWGTSRLNLSIGKLRKTSPFIYTFNTEDYKFSDEKANRSFYYDRDESIYPILDRYYELYCN